jgi:hypothetical protein
MKEENESTTTDASKPKTPERPLVEETDTATKATKGKKQNQR